ncbi:DUF6944 family repetitive protein [Virgibacillus kimchii]
MSDNGRELIGVWIDATGTIISLLGEVRKTAGFNEINHRIVMIGEGLQSIGTGIMATTTTDSLAFFGDWVDSAGAGTSSLAAYLQDIDPENGDEALQLEILGDSMQSLGSSTSTVSSYLTGEEGMVLGNALQALGAGLESIGGLLSLKEQEQHGQILSLIGAALQALGSNYLAITLTREQLE